jgi:glycerophosphoryl diester phosphodiesterase
MKPTIIFLFLQLLLTGNIFAQSKSLYLTSYTYSPANKVIGTVKLADGTQLVQVKLSGRDAKKVSINDKQELSVTTSGAKADELHLVINAVTGSGSLKQEVTLLKDQFLRNKVIAHRGAWKNTGATENSIAALNHAVKMGCSGSEFDVHMSSDSVLFIHHDATINGLKIEETPSAKLREIKLENGEVFPTLREYLTAGMKQHQTKLVLEIKPSIVSKERAIALTRRTLALVDELKAQAWVDYISFDYNVCEEVIRLAPYAKVSYLNGDKSPADLAQKQFYGLDYHMNVLRAKPDWIKQAKDNRIFVNVWTVNNEADMDYFLKEGADVITTNEPELLLKKLSQ